MPTCLTEKHDGLGNSLGKTPRGSARNFKHRPPPFPHIQEESFRDVRFSIVQNEAGFTAFIDAGAAAAPVVLMNPVKHRPFSKRKNCRRFARHWIKHGGKISTLHGHKDFSGLPR